MSPGPDPTEHAGAAPGADPTAGPGQAGSPPSEEEMRAAYEAELDRIDAIDMIAQAAVSLLNIGARRLGPPAQPGAEQQGEPSGRDLQQAGDAIDAARALLAILERRLPEETKPLRDALSRLQMAYAAEIGAGGGARAPDEPPGAGDRGQGGAGNTAQQEPSPGQEQGGAQGSEPHGPGPAESSGKLWVPGR